MSRKLLFVQGFSLQQRGGGGTIIRRLMSHAVEKGFQPFACFDRNEIPEEVKGKIDTNQESPIETSGRTIKNVKFSRLNPLLKLLILLGIDQKAKRSFFGLLKKIQPDVIHITAHGLSFPLFFMLSKKWAKARVVISVHDLWQFTIWDKYPTWLIDYLFGRCLRNADVCYVICPEMGDFLKLKYGIRDFTVIHDGYTAAATIIKSKKTPNSFLYVGILTDNQKVLLDRLVKLMGSTNVLFNIGICSNTRYAGWLPKNVHIENYGWVSPGKLEDISRDYMFGLLPLSFEPDRILFYQTSLMTKIPFYFKAGLPVYCIGKANAASVRLLQREHAGICCTSDCDEDIAASLEQVKELSTIDYAEMVNQTQNALATTFNITYIVERFYRALI